MAAADGGLDGDAIAHGQRFDARTDGGDLAGGFVAEYGRVLRGRSGAVLLQVIVHVAAADAAGAQAYHDFSWARIGRVGNRAEFHFLGGD
jgi:hypothetical protein